jgi:diaminohydroxyphosphoribosylaminopyrimidine deaminase / 5-amino-6-(5-phosphoribosylamino)uracil reductase
VPGPPAFTAADERMMRRALALAARGLGETSPNPVVGCVIARAGRVVGEGFHARAGSAHAEALALQRAGARARGATLYVTLEPCAHHGRTPPCAPLVRESGVVRVVAAVRDPNPLVAGRGLALLRRAGIAVDTGLLGPEAARLNERFLAWAARGRPYVLLKAALTLDGRIATASGLSKWITSPAQRREARWLRRLHDAVLVGSGTALADDPLLLPTPRTRRPVLRVVLDSQLRLPPRGRLAATAGPRTPVLVLSCAGDAARRRALEEAGVEVAEVAGERGRGSLPAAREALRARGVTSRMVEGGGEVLGSVLAARLVDQVALFRAPLLLGGRGSRPAFGGPDPLEVRDGLRLEPVPAEPAFPWPWPPQFELWRPRR